MEFLEAVTRHPFLQHALLAGVLASIACGTVGSFVVVRRITAIAGAIAHCVLGGLGLARWLQVVHGWTWLDPMTGAVVAAVAAALILGIVSLRAREREDTIIAALWAVGMAIGVIFISRTPGANQDLMSYLFGNILLVTPDDLWMMVVLDAIVVGVVVLFFAQLQAVCFDDEFARVRGLAVEAYYLVLLTLTALTVVLLVRVVGIILVIALLTLPVAIASRFSHSLRHIMVGAVGLSMVLTTAGLAISYRPDLPSGATTIVLAGVVYLSVLAVRRLQRRAHAPSATPDAKRAGDR